MPLCQPDYPFLFSTTENLFVALGAVVMEGRGSRMRVELNGVVAVFHRPHPEKEASKGRVKAAREFLEKAGVEPQEDGI